MSKEPSGATRGLTPGEKWAVASLVSYQPGSVVSRTIISDRAGTVTLFAFDEGEGLSEHTAPYDALLHFWRARPKSNYRFQLKRVRACHGFSARPPVISGFQPSL